MTRPFLLTSVLLFLSFLLNAQIKKSSVLVGGQVYYYSDKVNDPNNIKDPNLTSLYLNISAGQAFKENQVLGINVAYGSGNSKNYFTGAQFININVDAYNAGLFYRQYKMLAKDFYFFVQSDAAFIYSHQTDKDTAGSKIQDIKQHGGFISLTPGISYQIFKSVHLEITIPSIMNVQYAVTKSDAGKKEREFSFNSSLNSNPLNFLGVGFHYIF